MNTVGLLKPMKIMSLKTRVEIDPATSRSGENPSPWDRAEARPSRPSPPTSSSEPPAPTQHISPFSGEMPIPTGFEHTIELDSDDESQPSLESSVGEQEEVDGQNANHRRLQKLFAMVVTVDDVRYKQRVHFIYPGYL